MPSLQPQPSPVTPAPIPAPVEVPVLGVPLALLDYEETMDRLDAMIARDERGYVIVAAVHSVMMCQEDSELRDAVMNASMRVPDGKPLVWAINALGHELHDRVYGPELMARYSARCAQTGARAFLYGGRNQGALVQLALNLRRAHPGLRIVGGYSPPYRDLDDEERQAVVGEINRSGADIVWTGIGVPKQEKWMARMRDELRPPVLIGVGAAFDFHAGLIPQAPDRVQELGLEWAYRLAHEPRRLWRRYARYNPRFVAGFARQYGRHRSAQRT